MPGVSIFTKKADNASSSVDEFLASKGVTTGRIAFVLDATASRQPTWDMSQGLMGDMIREAGQLEMKLIFFRGGNEGPKQCKTSDWISDPTRFARLMGKVECLSGYTQIARALAQAKREENVGAIILIGDQAEPVEDNLDRLGLEARDLKAPVFAFQEGFDRATEKAFRQIAELSKGAYGRFGAGSAKQLGELLKAAAVVAKGGVKALEGRQDEASKLLLEQMRG